MDNPRERYSIVVEPSGEIYQRLLQRLTQYCDEIMLVIREPGVATARAKEVVAALSSALISESEKDEWPGTKLRGKTASVFRYRLDDAVREILCESVQNLYGWVPPERPEDLSMWENGRPMLTTVAHERDGYLDLTSGQVQELRDIVPDLRLFHGNIMPRAAEPYRLFGAFLDERSLRRTGSVEAALAEYMGTVSDNKVNEAIATIQEVMTSRKDHALVRTIMERWGAAPTLTEGADVLTILGNIAGRLDEQRRRRRPPS
jgi:hypothetical protein